MIVVKSINLSFINTGSFRYPSFEGHPHMRDSFPSYEYPFFLKIVFLKLDIVRKEQLLLSTNV